MADLTDMRGYIAMLEEMGELRRLEGVDLNLEVGAWGDSWDSGFGDVVD
jgi:3-polyprenyl-4-hydroxybenzoate decarboxylase